VAVWGREEPVAGRCQAAVELSELLLRRRPLRLLHQGSSASTGGDEHAGDAYDDEPVGVEDLAVDVSSSSSSSCDEDDEGVKSHLMGVSTHSMVADNQAGLAAAVADSVCALAMVSSLSI
jgi:hypothetical protein